MFIIARCLVSFLQGCAEDSPENAKFIGNRVARWPVFHQPGRDFTVI